MSLAQAEAYKGTLPSSQRRRSEVTRWFAALDNYSPTREHTNGHAVSFTLPTTGQTGYVLFGIDKLVLPAESVYVVQDAEGNATAMYPVAWHGAGDEYGTRVVLHPYPNDGPMPMGPKRSYHIRLRSI